VQKAFKANRKVEYLNGSRCHETRETEKVLDEAARVLEEGVHPQLVEDGLGGTYFIKDRLGDSIAVFKPRDEEALAPNNPKMHAGGGQGKGLMDGVLVGEAALNEYAAFLIDRGSSPVLRAGVPATALVRMCDSVFHSAKEDRRSAFRKVKDKVGSFQLFVVHDCTSEDLGRSRFPADLVHRLAVLDIRLCNEDRHAGNILVREVNRQVAELVPIDHGYTLPGEVVGASFEWLQWPAASQPFSEEMKREILAIRIDDVEAKLKKRLPTMRPECLATLHICTALLQHGVKAGLTAADIGGMMCQTPCGNNEVQQPSELEEIVAEAGRLAAEEMAVSAVAVAAATAATAVGTTGVMWAADKPSVATWLLKAPNRRQQRNQEVQPPISSNSSSNRRLSKLALSGQDGALDLPQPAGSPGSSTAAHSPAFWRHLESLLESKCDEAALQTCGTTMSRRSTI
jgi:hypothetical protein